MSWLVLRTGFPQALVSHLEMMLQSSFPNITCPVSLGTFIRSNSYFRHARQPFFFFFSFGLPQKLEGMSHLAMAETFISYIPAAALSCQIQGSTDHHIWT